MVKRLFFRRSSCSWTTEWIWAVTCWNQFNAWASTRCCSRKSPRSVRRLIRTTATSRCHAKYLLYHVSLHKLQSSHTVLSLSLSVHCLTLCSVLFISAKLAAAWMQKRALRKLF